MIPGELIALHAANLARMTRTRLARPEGGVLIWHHDPENGALISHGYAPAVPEALALGCFRVLWDDALRITVRRERERRLPNETGGVLLGYFDLVAGTVMIVDALSAPPIAERSRPGSFAACKASKKRSLRPGAARPTSCAMWGSGTAIRSITLPRPVPMMSSCWRIWRLRYKTKGSLP